MNCTSLPIGALALILAVPAQAALVLDQEHIASGDSIVINSSTVTGFRRAQTVTAGTTGTLGQVHIQMFPTSFNGFDYSAAFVANVTGLNILDTLGGIPQTAASAILGTGTYVGLDGDWAIFNTSLSITEGQIFAIEPVTTIQVSAWRKGGGYAGGNDYFQSGPGFITTLAGGSNGFRTFTLTPIPLPSALWLMMTALTVPGLLVRLRPTAISPAR